VSALALIILYPALASFAQNGISPQRINEKERTGRVASWVSYARILREGAPALN
jgi:hypothetical protein